MNWMQEVMYFQPLNLSHQVIFYLVGTIPAREIPLYTLALQLIREGPYAAGSLSRVYN